MQYSEIELISEIKKKNQLAFDSMIGEYTKPVYYLVYNILNIGNSKEDIEECVSDVFVEAWEKIDRYDPQKGNFRKWLLMLAKYQNRDLLWQNGTCTMNITFDKSLTGMDLSLINPYFIVDGNAANHINDSFIF